MADDIYGINTTVNSNCWGIKDIDNVNSSRVSFRVSSWRSSSVKI